MRRFPGLAGSAPPLPLRHEPRSAVPDFRIFGGSKTDDRESAAGTSYCDDVSVRPASAEEVRALRDYRVTVDAAAPLREINPLFFGVNTLFWIEDDAALRDGKLARLLHDLPCRLMRFPGGEVADNYHWQTRKLDNFHDFPASEGPDKLDCDKFMTLCRQVGAEPIFVVNLESGFVHHDVAAAVREAADWVRYANREKNYAVKYWELGNETYLSGTRYPLTAREYAETAVQFSRAMKAVDPTIQIGLVGPHTTGSSTALDKLTPDELKKIRAVSRSTRKNTLKKDAPGNPVRESSPGVPWWPTLVRLAGADMDFAVIHRYYPDTFGPDANVAKYIAPLREFFAKEIPGRKIPFALTEWNSGPDTPSSLASALIVAELIPDYLKAGVELACFWPMRYPSSGWNVRALIDDQTNEPRPSYQVMKLYTANMTGDAKLLPTAASSKSIYTAASLAPDSKRVTVFLINKALVKEPATVAIRLEGFAAKTATAVTLTGPDLKKNQAALASLPVTVQAG
ncbi:MAG: hypothetical protein NTZ16_15560, partial [Verrucomicrobia bacterium]|nr:hypothetical protein [Verrucomicrobiota bacterium]